MFLSVGREKPSLGNAQATLPDSQCHHRLNLQLWRDLGCSTAEAFGSWLHSCKSQRHPFPKGYIWKIFESMCLKKIKIKQIRSTSYQLRTNASRGRLGAKLVHITAAKLHISHLFEYLFHFGSIENTILTLIKAFEPWAHQRSSSIQATPKTRVISCRCPIGDRDW